MTGLQRARRAAVGTVLVLAGFAALNGFVALVAAVATSGVSDGTVLLICLAPAVAIAVLVGFAVRYQPGPAGPQCPLHEDCAGGCPDLPVAAAEFAACGYTDFDRWRAA